MKPYFTDGLVTLYHGDCRDVLETLDAASVDLLLTDPPYGMQYEGSGKSGAQANVRGDGARQGMRLLRAALSAMAPAWKEDAHAYVFCHWESWPDFYDTASAHLSIRNALVWDKAAGGTGDTECDYARDYEVVLYGIRGRRPLAGRRDGAVLRGHKAPHHASRVHPTEKPESLLAYLIRKSCPPGGLVVDPFAGSGSTLVAAKREGRRAIGIELDERWIEAAARRLDQSVLDLGVA